MATTTKKATTSAKPTATKPTKRADLLTMLDKHGYTGPRSYTATMLSAVVEWLDAKAPKDKAAGIPEGVLFSVHPDLRPAAAPKGRRLSSGYLAACADVLNALDAGDDVREFVTTRLASGEVPA